MAEPTNLTDLQAALLEDIAGVAALTPDWIIPYLTLEARAALDTLIAKGLISKAHGFLFAMEPGRRALESEVRS